jgi:parallel beta-helix repeat protein
MNRCSSEVLTSDIYWGILEHEAGEGRRWVTMYKTRRYAKSISLVVVLTLVLSLGIIALPMAEMVEAEDPATLHVDAVNGTIGMGNLCPPLRARGSAIFKDIQKAINCALPGDTIMVHPGKYDETVTINKSLTLQSTDGWQNTAIDPPLDSIIIISGDVDATVEGFNISGGTHGIYIPQLNSTVNISGCFIHGNVQDGIHINNVPEDAAVTITDNFIVDNGDDGIEVAEAASVNGSVTIKDNVIGAWRYDSSAYAGNNETGIHVGHVNSTGTVTILGNAISENGADGINFGSGVLSIFGNVSIRDNLIGAWTCYDGDYGYSGTPQRYHGNYDKGIEIIQVGDSGASGTVIIEGNKISENPTTPDLTGIYIWNIYGVVTIARNDIGNWTDRYGASYLGNNGHGIYVQSVLSGAELTIGPDNFIKENTEHGIWILWGQQNASIEIHHNVIDDNGPSFCGCGIKLGSGGVFGAIISDNTITNHHKGVHLDSNSKNNTIRDNEIRDNFEGVWVDGDDNEILLNNIVNNHAITSGVHLNSDASGNIIHCNNIEGNLEYGVYNENSLENVIATNNWWGDASGPSNSPGTGDKVSDNVTYAPWLPMEFQYCEKCGGTPPVPPPPVGGEAYPVNKISLLAPWIAFGAAIMAGASILLRRRRAGS